MKSAQLLCGLLPAAFGDYVQYASYSNAGCSGSAVSVGGAFVGCQSGQQDMGVDIACTNATHGMMRYWSTATCGGTILFERGLAVDGGGNCVSGIQSICKSGTFAPGNSGGAQIKSWIADTPTCPEPATSPTAIAWYDPGKCTLTSDGGSGIATCNSTSVTFTTYDGEDCSGQGTVAQVFSIGCNVDTQGGAGATIVASCSATGGGGDANPFPANPALVGGAVGGTAGVLVLGGAVYWMTLAKKAKLAADSVKLLP